MKATATAIFGVVALLSALLMSVGALDASAATVAYWRFEPGDLTADTSGNGHTLVNTGVASSIDMPGAPPFGNTGSALFDGADIMSTVSTLDLTSYSEVTIEWFMKPTDPGLGMVWEHSAGADTTDGGIEVIIGDGVDQMYPLQRRVGPYNATVVASVPGGTTGGAWHHYAVEMDAAKLELYIDGVLSGANNAAAAFPFLNDTFNIGRRSNGAFAFAGNIDELRISSGLLSPSQFLNAIPEPSTVALLGLGGLLVWRGRMCRQKAKHGESDVSHDR